MLDGVCAFTWDLQKPGGGRYSQRDLLGWAKLHLAQHHIGLGFSLAGSGDLRQKFVRNKFTL
jgi:hypothetical protein